MKGIHSRAGAWYLAGVIWTGVVASSAAAAETGNLFLNQSGFVPGAPKMAVVPANAGAEFWLVDVESGTEVLRGPLTTAQTWEVSGDAVRIADFSGFRNSGLYKLRVAGKRDSAAFRIDAGVYDGLLNAAIKAYYFNRAGAALEESHAGPFHRPAGHPDTVVYIHPDAASPQRPAHSVVSAPKGWYDAGDYNKYVVNSAITLYTLGKALQDHAAHFATQDLNIPESQNGLPDFLDEILWNLDWFEAMQDPFDGGVYHKLSTMRFTDTRMPHQVYQSRYMMPKSTAATLDYAAVMAFASRLVKPWEAQLPGRAERYRQQAEKAWQWAIQNPQKPYVQPKGANTGLYARITDEFADERLWAAAELYLATGRREYVKAIRLPAKIAEPDWGDVGALALYSLSETELETPFKPPAKLRRAAESLLLGAADGMIQQYRQSAYRVPMVAEDFVWGSNAVAMNKAMLLLHAGKIQPGGDHMVAAQALLDYVLGRNPTGYSFVTGAGIRSPMHIHHRISAADAVVDPVPGMLVGGPQPGWQDQCKYPSRQPALSWLDDWCSFSTNEVAINWNAPLVYVLAALRQYPDIENPAISR